jgi:nucleotide-binding universal stress UspA family protein
MKILLAVDGSAGSQAAVKAVAHRPWPPESKIKVLTAVEPGYVPMLETWSVPDNYYQQIEDSAVRHAQAVVTDAATQLREHQLAVTVEVQPGHAREVILHTAESWQPDLIVVGSHGYSGWQRFWLGSVSQAVASKAHCSVEIVRQ